MDNIKLPSAILEPTILAYSLTNVSFFLKIRPHLFTTKGKSYFNDEKYQGVFNWICKYFDKYKAFPQKETLRALVDKFEEDKEIKLYMLSIVDKMFAFDRTTIDEKYVEDEVLNFIKEAKVYEAIIQSQVDIEKRNFGAIVSRVEEAVRINFDKDLGISILDVDETLARIKQMDQEIKIPTGFGALDNILDGGIHPKEIYCFASPPGIGKTLVMGNIATNLFLNNKKVLVYTFETSTERLLMRYYANLARMTKKEIFLNEQGLKENFEKIKSMTTGDIMLKEYNANTVSSNDLMAHINDLQMYKKFKPDAIIVDYTLIMNTNDRNMSKDSTYLYYKIVTEELRNIAKTLCIPIITACQINREGMGDQGGTKITITSKSISESRGILDTVDVFITIIQTPSQRKNNRLTLYIDKNRNDKNGVRIDYSVDYDHMKLTEHGFAGGA
jgi:replicative DNA helicase